ncbi:hypothetical protein [Persicobacter diffluens]|uniref:Uncharacterized protein n=1 Tax=Persicobacter diffluens TaxID=981 RepID=A0AAN4W034_9BACT|nr:hypothetical protein PEDI_20270 [Persicobacter diffluens]
MRNKKSMGLRAIWDSIRYYRQDKKRFADLGTEEEAAKLFNYLQECYVQHYGLIPTELEDEEDKALPLQAAYAVQGHNPDFVQNFYAGIIAIEKIGLQVKAQWQIGLEAALQWGKGKVLGQYLCVDFQYDEEATTYSGRVLYKRVGNSLVGFWMEPKIASVGFERLVEMEESFS